MRYIDMRDLQIDAGWVASANAAMDAVRRAAADKRSDAINRHQEVWKNLKDKLRALSYDKCWYCESIDPRSDNAVDHYRPKGNVKGAEPPHTGYWWLAFDWKNYRFCCTYCNSLRTSAAGTGGKQDYFPLWQEDARAKSETDDLDNELPLLLDPTRVTDVRLIAFSEDGSVGPADPNTRSREYRMADESITRYHLKHPTLAERRAFRLREVLGWVHEADKNLARHAKQPNPQALVTAEARLQDIRGAVSHRAVYSMAVKHLLSGIAHKSDAARKVLDSL